MYNISWGNKVKNGPLYQIILRARWGLALQREDEILAWTGDMMRAFLK
jgi:hypothetical protein